MEQVFDNDQISCFFGLLQKVLEDCQSNISLEDNSKNFSSYFTGVKKWGPTHVSGMEKFNIKQSKQIIDYMYQGYVMFWDT